MMPGGVSSSGVIVSYDGMIGDDRLQQQSQGYVRPDSFSHGSSAQRVRWFRQGYQTGRVDGCDTFGADDL